MAWCKQAALDGLDLVAPTAAAAAAAIAAWLVVDDASWLWGSSRHW